MSKKQSLAENIVKEEEAGLELGTFAKEVLGISNRKLQQAVRTKGLRVNGRSAHSNRKIRSGDKVEVLLPAKEQIKIEIAEPTDLKVLFEDSWLFAVEKPAGIPTYDSKGAKGLANQVAGYYLNQGQKLTPRPIHRLDTPTSGVLLFAKDSNTQTLLNKLWKQKAVKRIYFALCQGQLSEAQEIDIPLGGKEALTRLKPVKIHPACTELEVELISGRTHQIRRHLAELGHPILGDRRYGRGEKVSSRLALHAISVSFTHPYNHKEKVIIHSPVPYDEFSPYFA